MQRISPVVAIVLMSLTVFGAPGDTPEAAKLMKRAWELTHTRQLLYCYIPARGDFAKKTGDVANMIGYAAKKHQPLVIYSPDPATATRMITIAFAVIRPGALRGSTIIAAVGEKNDSYIRPVIEATGAKLYVEPLP